MNRIKFFLLDHLNRFSCFNSIWYKKLFTYRLLPERRFAGDWVVERKKLA